MMYRLHGGIFVWISLKNTSNKYGMLTLMHNKNLMNRCNETYKDLIGNIV
jgi:hypothetical protein